MSIPAALLTELQTVLMTEIEPGAGVGGGCINHATRARLGDGREVLVKWRGHTPPGMFAAEEQGLNRLASSRTLRVPQVYAAGDPEAERPGFIVLEWLGRGASSRQVDAALGRGLALLHRATGPFYGLDHDNYIGANPQPNTPTDDWVSFFGRQRLGFQMELAARNGYLSKSRRQRLENLISRLSDFLPASPLASLLHGDLWGGNWLVTAAGEPALIDPAVYYGDREAELAFTELFGGFSRTFYEAYQAAWPLEPGYPERQALYNLYHLLNHLNLFGEGYGSQVDAILARYYRTP